MLTSKYFVQFLTLSANISLCPRLLKTNAEGDENKMEAVNKINYDKANS